MPRNVSAAMKTALASDGFRMAHLVYLGISSGIRATDCPSAIVYDSNTYNPSVYLLEVGSPSESRDLRVNQLGLQFSGVGQSYQSIFLNNDWLNRQGKVWKAVIDDTGAIVGDPLVVFDGQITNWQFQESGGSSTVTVSLSSHWADFQKKQGRLTNNNSQQFYFSGDVGFEYASHTVKDIRWGRK